MVYQITSLITTWLEVLLSDKRFISKQLHKTPVRILYACLLFGNRYNNWSGKLENDKRDRKASETLGMYVLNKVMIIIEGDTHVLQSNESL